jgi:hypothetical protein
VGRDAAGRFVGGGGGQAAAIGREIRAHIENAAKALVLQIARELRLNPGQGGTPVDTGHARANWIASVSAPSEAVTAGADSSAYQAGVAQIAAYVLEQGPLWLVNNVPYIRALNYGHSKQAPALFVEAAVDRALAAIERMFGSGAVGFTRGEFQSAVGADGAENMASFHSPFGGADD